MAPEIAEGTRAKIPPGPPFVGSVFGVVGSHGGRSDPHIPVHAFGHGRRVLGAFDFDALRPHRSVGPGVHFAHRADGSAGDPLANQPGAVARVPLVAHLGDDLVFASGFGEFARFVHGMGHRLLHIDMLAGLDGCHGDHGVSVIRRGNDDRVDILLLVDHLPVVLVGLGLRILGEYFGGVAGIDVTQRDDILTGALLEIVLPHAPHADGRDIQFPAGRSLAPGSDHVTGHNAECGNGSGGSGQETSPVQRGVGFGLATLGAHRFVCGCGLV